MGGPAEIQLVAASRAEATSVATALESECRRIEAKFSRFDPSSIISRINNAAGAEKLDVDDELAALIDYAAVCHVQSKGLFDITSGVPRRAWDFKAGFLPSQQQVAALLPLIGWDKVHWHRPTIQLPIPGMEIDLGGLAKEYAVDRIVALAQAAGIPAGLSNLAGDLRVFGRPPEGSAWKIGIAHPRDRAAVLAHIELEAGAVATSGDYERYFEVDGRRYCHILNPQTGYPCESFQSVSVVAASCLIAGTASTIAMLLGESGGKEFLRELGLPFLVRTAGGQRLHCKMRLAE